MFTYVDIKAMNNYMYLLDLLQENSSYTTLMWNALDVYFFNISLDLSSMALNRRSAAVLMV